jgi:hypothetical protein
MKRLLFGLLLLSICLFGEEKSTESKNGSFTISKDNREHTLIFTKFNENGEYSVNVGARGGRFVSASAPSGIIVTPADQSNLFSSASAKKTVTKYPDAFNFLFDGYFRPNGEKSGDNDLYWKVDVDTKFYVVQSGDTKDIISLVGNSVSFNSYEGSQLVDSSWLITRQSGGSCTKNIASNFFHFSDDISTAAWCVPGTSNVDGDMYIIKGTHNSNDATDQGTLKVVAPDTIKLSSTSVVSNKEYGKSSADNISKTFIRGDQDRSAIQLTVTTTPLVNYNDIPAGWVGISTESYASASIAGLYTPDASQPKLRGKLTPNVLGCVGYLYAGGASPAYQKFIRFIKFGIVVIPSNAIYDLYVFKTKKGHESMEFTAAVNPAYMFDTVDTSTRFTWEITEGSDKVSIIKSGNRDNTCTITAKSVDKLSDSIGDVKLKVTWNYNGTEKGEKEIAFTVRSIWSLRITSNSRPNSNAKKWVVTYSLLDNFNTALPNEVCNGLRAYESFTQHLWPGLADMGNPVLSSNYLTDTFIPPALINSDGDGTQTITIDHMKRTHHISIPILGDSVIYTNVNYQRNQ